MLVFFGDSNTWGFDPRSYIGGRYPRGTRWTGLVEDALGEKVLNLGLNGRVIPGRGAGLELGEGGRLIIMLGTNDILNGESAAGCARRASSPSRPARRDACCSRPPSRLSAARGWTARGRLRSRAALPGSTGGLRGT